MGASMGASMGLQWGSNGDVLCVCGDVLVTES